MLFFRRHIENYYINQGVENILWTNCKKRTSKALKDLQKMILEMLQKEHRFNRTVKNEYQIVSFFCF